MRRRHFKLRVTKLEEEWAALRVAAKELVTKEAAKEEATRKAPVTQIEGQAIAGEMYRRAVDAHRDNRQLSRSITH